jgi:hypothetical protein
MKIALKIIKIKNLIETLENNLENLYPLTDSKKILIISLQKMRILLSECINLSLLIGYKQGVIKKTNDKNKNLKQFFNKCVINYNLTKEQIQRLKKILIIAKNQRESSMDFKVNQKLASLSHNLNVETITFEELKIDLNLIQKLFLEINTTLK